MNTTNDESTKVRRLDELWAVRIRAALAENRFRLAHLPVAALNSNAEPMHDMLIRMIDEQGEMILPSEFLPAAERSNLLKVLDRWMISSSIRYCSQNDVACVLVRISPVTLLDKSLLGWLKSKLNEYGVAADRICFQMPEQEAAKFIRQARVAVAAIRSLGTRFALQHFGIVESRFQILDLLKPDMIKIDGEVMHTLASDTEMQDKVRAIAEEAAQRDVKTIAERVENANVMAILFQFGISYMQGHYVEEPEVILQDPETIVTTTLEAIASG